MFENAFNNIDRTMRNDEGLASERVDNARSAGLSGYEVEMQAILESVLRAYGAHGIEDLSLKKIHDLLRIRYGGTNDAKKKLGDLRVIKGAFTEIQFHLFR